MFIAKGQFDTNSGEGILYSYRKRDEQFWDVETSWDNSLCLTSQGENKLYLNVSPTEAVGLIKALKQALNRW